jgi:hypothetical protein
MKTVSYLREELFRAGLQRTMPVEDRRKLLKQAKRARRKGEYARSIISDLLRQYKESHENPGYPYR